MTFGSWLRSVGALRGWLLALALMVWLPSLAFDPAFFISNHPVVLPPLVLIVLDAVKTVCSSIIIVECIRVLAFRWTQSLGFKKHLALVLGFALLSGVIKVATAPTTAVRYYSYAWSLTESQQYEEALRSLDIAITYNPKYAKALLERAYVRRRLGDYTVALHDCNKAIGLTPNDATAYVSRGQAYYYLGDYRQAMKDFDKAMSLDPKVADSFQKWIEAIKKNL